MTKETYWEKNYNIHICTKCHTLYDEWSENAQYVKGSVVCPKCGCSKKDMKENGTG